MSVFGINVFALVVVFLAGVVTGGMVVFFVRGPVVAFFRVKDEPADPVYVEVQASESYRRARVRRGRPWERVAGRPRPYSALPVDSRKELGRGGAS